MKPLFIAVLFVIGLSNHSFGNSIGTKDSISWLVDSLSQYKNWVQLEESQGLGTVEPAIQYLWYVELLKAASDEDLISLTNNKCLPVRCYAFMGLATRHYKGLKRLLFVHMKDISKVDLRGSCVTLESCPANVAYAELVRSNDDCYVVTEKDFHKLRYRYFAIPGTHHKFFHW